MRRCPETIQLRQASFPCRKGMVFSQIGKICLADLIEGSLFAVRQKDTSAAEGVIDQDAMAALQHMTCMKAVISALRHEDKAGILPDLEHRVVKLQNAGRYGTCLGEEFQEQLAAAYKADFCEDQ